MTLYAADIMDLAKPIEKQKKRSKKQEPLTPPASESTELSDIPMVSEKPKKVLTEKQQAALVKAQETRQRKKEEKLKEKQLEQEAIQKKQEEIAVKEQELAAKKEAMKEKRRLAREKRKEFDLDSEVDKQVSAVTKKQKTEDHPPAWFQKYVEGVRKEQARDEKPKKPIKVIQQEAVQVAQHKWEDGLTRDRLRNEVDGHMNRMYSMIFGNRALR